MVVVTLFTVICCSFNVSAINETITIIPTKHGSLYNGESKEFSFSIPTSSTISINFYDYDLDYDYGTYGSVLIRIKNVADGTWVYEEETFEMLGDEKFSVTLPKGDYKLYFTENVGYYSDFYYVFNATAKLLEEVQYTALSLNKTKASLAVKKSLQLTEKHEPASATVKPTWTTSNKNVATVNSNGKVTAKALGTAKITAKLGNKSASCVINVTLNNTYVTVATGKTLSIKSAFKTVSGYKKAKYSSSNKKVATVNSSGVVKGKKAGKVTICATVNGVKYNQKVNVKNPSIALSKSSATLYKGDIKAAISTSIVLKATTFPAKQKITWKSSNTKVAKVSKNGKVTPVAPGKATIKATFKCAGKTYSKSCKVTVKLRRAVTLKVSGIDDVGVYNDCYIKFSNNTNKKVKYITFDIKQYDNRGYKLSSPYEFYYLNETLKPNSYEYYSYWVNDDTKYAKVKITKVWFSDGSTYTPK